MQVLARKHTSHRYRRDPNAWARYIDGMASRSHPSARHGRHGRTWRSTVVRPPLRPADARDELFDAHVGGAAEFLRHVWPELASVEFLTAPVPPRTTAEGVPRYLLDHEAGTITVYRIPIERFLPPGHDDRLHRRAMTESMVFRAAAAYLDAS